MSKTQHTPGQYEAVGNLVRSSMVQTGDRPRGMMLAEVTDGYGLPHTEEAKATAVLFAAAPELLEAVQALLPYTDDLCDAGPEGQGWKSPELNAAIDKARAAIAKATGSAA